VKIVNSYHHQFNWRERLLAFCLDNLVVTDWLDNEAERVRLESDCGGDGIGDNNTTVSSGSLELHKHQLIHCQCRHSNATDNCRNTVQK